MKKYIVFVLIVFVASLSACTDSVIESKSAKISIPAITNQSQALIKFFSESGDYVNGVEAPFLITADEVNENKDNYLIIDVRYHEDYLLGHIDGALNVDREMLVEFLKATNIYQYKKIVIVDNTGQAATYITSLLRGMGFGSTYAMKFGMTAWSKSITDTWNDNIGNKYVEFITSNPTEKNKKGSFPKINTKGNTISEILEIRVQDEIKYNFAITIDSLIMNVDDYYVINYISEARYNIGHIKNSVWYQPKKSMNISESLASLPSDKKIVIYCYIGHHGSALTAYLRLLGYDAYSLRYGVNSFMYKFAEKNKWATFNANDVVNDFALVKGEKPSKEVKAKANKIVNPILNYKRHDVVLPDPSEVCD